MPKYLESGAQAAANAATAGLNQLIATATEANDQLDNALVHLRHTRDELFRAAEANASPEEVDIIFNNLVRYYFDKVTV